MSKIADSYDIMKAINSGRLSALTTNKLIQ